MPHDQRRPFFAGGVTPNVLGVGGNFGWTQGIDFFCNCGAQLVQLAADASFTRRFTDGYSCQVNYTLQKAEQERRRVLLLRSGPEQGTGRVRPDAHLQLGLVYELPFGKDKKCGNDWSPSTEAFLGGWQFNANVRSSRAACRST